MGRSFANLRILPSVFGIPQFCESCREGTASGVGVGEKGGRLPRGREEREGDVVRGSRASLTIR
jgi:hypothetical protein